MWRFYILILVLFFTFSVQAIEKSKPKWKTVTVLKVVDNEHFMLKNQKVIKIIAIKSPNIYIPKKSEECLSRPIFRTLESLLNGRKVKIFEDNYQNENYEFPRHIKLLNGKILSEFLLKKGFAKFDANYLDKKYRKKYIKAQEQAKINHVGLWGGCNSWNNLKHRRKKQGTYPSFFKKYSNFLASISVGRVKEIISGNKLKLNNGLKIKLIGVEVPDSKNENFKCFNTKSKEYLENLILGKQIFLIKDKSQLDQEGFLLRYVYRLYDNIFVNKKIIQDGYAKSYWNGIDDKFEKEFKITQENIYKNPNGAWKSCVEFLLERHTNKTKEKITKKIIYDDECRIKGNISGSKKNPQKTYHTPLSGWYKRLKYEECFETEEEALKAGFKKIK